MKFTPLLFCVLLILPILSFAEDITLTDGTEFKDVEVIRVEKDGLVVQTSDGVQKIPMDLVPKEVQLVHPYVPPAPAATPTPDPTPQEVVEATPQPTPKATPPDVSGTNSLDANGESLAGKTLFPMSCEFFMKAAVAAFLVLLATLLVGWFIARRLLASLALRQKHKDFDSSNARQFHSAYTDFYAIWKLWNHYLDHGDNELPDHGEYEIPHATRWELLTRMYAAEGHIEAVFLRLASSRKLSPGAIELLGRFRQGFKTLGQAIKNNKTLAWKDPEHPDYLVFKRLASGVAMLIGGDNLGAQASDVRADAFRQITSGRWERSWSSESSHQSTEAM